MALDATPLLGVRAGIGTYVHELTRRLTERTEVTLVPFSLRGAAPPDDVPPGARWRRLPLPARGLQWSWQRLGIPTARPLAGRVQVFHGTNFVTPPPGRIPTVVTVHDLAYLQRPEWVRAETAALAPAVERSVRTSAVVLTPTHAVAAEVRDAFSLPAERVLATPLGVDRRWSATVPAGADELRALGLPPRFTLFVGTREPRKNLDLLLHAQRQARRRSADVPPLVLVGGRGWGAEPEVDGRDTLIAGRLPYAALPRVVAAATALCLPSHYEGFGLPVLEALAAGTPVVASDIPAHREVGGDVPALVPADDIDAWTEALMGVSAGQGTDRRAAGRARAAIYTWEACAEATVIAYQRAATRCP